MYICLCKGLTETAVRNVANTQGATPQALLEAIGWDDGTCCGRCASGIDKIFSFVTRPNSTAASRPLAVVS
jgi:bacterioferritin-associated ferredoxin